MSYKLEHLVPVKRGAEESGSDRRTLGKQIVVYTVVGTLTLGAFPHAVECVTRDEPGSLYCESKAPKRHDLHIESAANSSNTSSGVQMIALVSDAGFSSAGDLLDWINRPRT